MTNYENLVVLARPVAGKRIEQFIEDEGLRLYGGTADPTSHSGKFRANEMYSEIKISQPHKIDAVTIAKQIGQFFQ